MRLFLLAAGAVLATLADAGTPRGASRRTSVNPPVAKPPGAVRRIRSAATPRKLTAEELAGLQLLQGVPLVSGLVQVPQALIESAVGGGNTLAGAAFGTPPNLQDGLTGIVNKARNQADTSLDTIDQIAQGISQRGRSVIDRATSRAASIVDNSVALGQNTVGAGYDAARGLQQQAQVAAQQAGQAANGAVRAGELAFAQALDRLTSSVNGYKASKKGALTGQGAPVYTQNVNGLLGNPIQAILGVAGAA